MAEKQVVDYILNVQVAGAKRDLDKMARAAGTASRDVDELGDESKKSAKKVDKLGKDSKKAGKDIIGSFSKAANIVTGLQSAFALAGQAYDVFSDAMRAGFDVTRETVDNINQLNDATQRSGLSAGGVQAIIQAFEGAGLSAGAAEAFITRLPKQLNDLSDSSSDAAKAYEILGGSVRDSNGDLKATDTLLREMTQIFQQMEDPGKRANAVYEILGRSAGSFLQAFGATAEFEKFLAFSDEFGVKTGPKASKEAGTFQEALSAIGIQSKGLMQQLVTTGGGMSAFNKSMIQVIKTMGFLKGFIEESKETFQVLGSIIVRLAKFAFETVLTGAINTATHGVFRFSQQFDLLADKLLGVRPLEDIANQAKHAALEIFGFNDALAVGAREADAAEKAFLDIIGGIEKDQEAIDAMNEKLKKLFDTLGQTGDEAEELGEKTMSMADMIKEANGIINDANADLVTEQEAIENSYQMLIKKIDEYEDAGLKASKAAQARAAAERRALRDLAVLHAEQAEARQKEADKIDAAIDKINAKLQKQFEMKITVAVESFETAAQRFVDVITGNSAAIGQMIGEQVGVFLGNALAQRQERQIEKAAQPTFRDFEAEMRGETPTPKVGLDIDPAATAAMGEGIGAAVASALLSVGGFLAQIGRKTEAELREEAESTARAIAMGLRVLPALLFDILPDAIRLGVSEIILALRELPVRIALLIAQRIGEFVADPFGGIKGAGAEIVADMGAAMRQVGEGFRDAFRIGGKMNGGPFIPSAANGIRFTGSQRGLAMLHEGETVIPRSGRQSQATARNMAGLQGGGITVNINAAVVDGNAVDHLVREMENRFRTFGQGTSPLFAG